MDYSRIRDAIAMVKAANPTSATYSDPCTVGDIRKVTESVATALATFAEELGCNVSEIDEIE